MQSATSTFVGSRNIAVGRPQTPLHIIRKRSVRLTLTASTVTSTASSDCDAKKGLEPPPLKTNAMRASVEAFCKNLKSMSAFPVAVAGMGGDGSMLEVYGAIGKALDIYLVLLTVRVLLTWFRNISWTNEPFNTIRQFTDPYLNLFRGVVPAVGGIDLSPMLGFFLLSFAAKQLRKMSFGL